MRLNRENGDHEIVRKSRITQEAAILRKMLEDAAEERDHTEGDHQHGYGNVHRQHNSRLQSRSAWIVRMEIRIQPLGASPNETEAGLDRGSKTGFGRG